MVGSSLHEAYPCELGELWEKAESLLMGTSYMHLPVEAVRVRQIGCCSTKLCLPSVSPPLSYLQLAQDVVLAVDFILLSFSAAVAECNREEDGPEVELVGSPSHWLWLHLLLASMERNA